MHVSYISVEHTVHEEDHETLQGGEDAEKPLYHLRYGTVVHHKEPQCPRDPKDGHKHKGGM